MTREEAIQFLDNMKHEEAGRAIGKDGFYADLMGYHVQALNMAIKALEQEPKTGHWIVDGSVDCYLDKVRCHCSECGKKKEFPADYDHIKHKLSISYQYPEFIDNYCPNCGAKMVEPQESEG